MTAAAFVSGSIMYSFFIPLIFFHKDIRKISRDKNPGSSNVIRHVGLVTGIICMILDVAKAFFPVFAAVVIVGLRGFYLVPVTAAPVLGHAFSPFLRFKGGKAVSTFYGALLGLCPVTWFVFLPALIMLFFRFAVIIRPDSVNVAVSLSSAVVFTLIFIPALWIKAVIIILSSTMIYRQKKNPDGGKFSIGIWHYIVKVRDRHIVFEKYGT